MTDGTSGYVPSVTYHPAMPLRTGKRPATKDDRDITLKVIAPALTQLPKPPTRFGHGTLYKGDGWQMLGNGPDDSVATGFQGAGDCVFAGAAHETMETNRLAGHRVPFTGRSVIDDYSAVTGYVLEQEENGYNPTDQGTNVRDALKYRQQTGVKDANGNRHRIGAYIALTPGDWDELMQAVYVFAAVGIGVEFPDSAMEQFDHGEPWDIVEGATVEGGHYVPVMGRSSVNVGGCVTWARRQPFTHAFYSRYCDEAWAIVFPEELRNGKTERGFDLAGLNAALTQLGR